MSKRKKQDIKDTRSKIEIEIDNVTAEIAATIEYNASCKEALADLGIHVQKIKQLETEMGPREVEHKTVLTSFQKVIDSNANIRGKSTAGEEGSAGGVSSGTTGPTQTRPSSRSAVKSDDGLIPLTHEQEARDREAMRQLQHVLKDNMSAVMVPLFNSPKTRVELAVDKQKEQERAEAKLAAEAEAKLAASGMSPSRGNSAGPKKPPPKAAAAAAAAKTIDGPDIDLLCPPGIEVSFYEEVLKLRSLRLTTESKLNAIQTQLTASRQVVAKRRDEGYTKQGLKKSEKKLVAINKQLIELQKIKAGDDAAKLKAGGDPKDKRKR